MAKDIEFVRFNRHAIPWRHEFHSKTGMVGRKITTMTHLAGVVARIEAPNPARPPNNRTAINYSTGDLASKIRSDVVINAKGDVEGRVVAVPEHAIYVHEGTIPHVIKAKPGGRLVFFWHKKGRVVSFDKVEHPGTRANQFLVRALVRVMKRMV